MPKDESYRIRCIDCKRGINGTQDCGAGWNNRSPLLGCYIGSALPDNDPNKGKIPDKIPGNRFYEESIYGITKKHRAKKEHKCNFCDGTIYKGESYLATFVRNPEDLINERRFWKSCMSCGATIISICGD